MVAYEAELACGNHVMPLVLRHLPSTMTKARDQSARAAPSPP